MSILRSVSSFLSVKKSASSSRSLQSQVIPAVKSLPFDNTHWIRLCSHAEALQTLLSTAHRRNPSSQLFWESLLETVRVLIAKDRNCIMQLSGKEADVFMCILQALLDFIPRRSVYRPSLLNTLMSLAVRSQCIPGNLEIHGVSNQTEEITFVCGLGDVKQARWKGKTIALKSLRNSLHFTDRDKAYRKLCREVLLWRQFRHPNLLEFIGILPSTGTSLLPVLVTPWMEHGNVLQYVKNRPHVQKLILLKQTARALNYLHRNDPPIVHQDVRCGNIFVNTACEAVLCDFGLTRVDDSSFQDIMLLLQDGCTRWQAPEILFPLHNASWPVTNAANSSSGSLVRASRKTDIWSFGMTIVELFTEAKPFAHVAHDAAVVIDLYHGATPRRPMSNEIKGEEAEIAAFDAVWEIVQSCWIRNPQERPSASILIRELGLEVCSKKVSREGVTWASKETNVTDSGYREEMSAELNHSRKEHFIANMYHDNHRGYFEENIPFDPIPAVSSPSVHASYRVPSVNSKHISSERTDSLNHTRQSETTRGPEETEWLQSSPLQSNYPHTRSASDNSGSLSLTSSIEDSTPYARRERGPASLPSDHNIEIEDLETIPDSEEGTDGRYVYPYRSKRPPLSGALAPSTSRRNGKKRSELPGSSVDSSVPLSSIDNERTTASYETVAAHRDNTLHSSPGSSQEQRDRDRPLSPSLFRKHSGTARYDSHTSLVSTRPPTRVGSFDSRELSPIPSDEEYSNSAQHAYLFESPPISPHTLQNRKSTPIYSKHSLYEVSSANTRSVSSKSSIHTSESLKSSRCDSPSRNLQVACRPSLASLPFKMISPACYEFMFGLNGDPITVLEHMHGVKIEFKYSYGDAKGEVYISAGGDMPDILSAQWEIEKMIEFYDTFGVKDTIQS